MAEDSGERKEFPVIRWGNVPWDMGQRAYEGYSGEYGSSQSIERIAERGGFHPNEMDQFVPGWREELSEITALRAEVERLRKSTPVARLDAMEAERDDVTAQLSDVQSLIDRQAKDDGLWFKAATAPEAYLQQELRKLHDTIECALPDRARAMLELRNGAEGIDWTWFAKVLDDIPHGTYNIEFLAMMRRAVSETTVAVSRLNAMQGDG